MKSIRDFDFGEVSFPEGYTADEPISLGFTESAQNLVFCGDGCHGKTHPSIAVEALIAERGYKVRHFETASMVLMLKSTVSDNKPEETLKDIARLTC